MNPPELHYDTNTDNTQTAHGQQTHISPHCTVHIATFRIAAQGRDRKDTRKTQRRHDQATRRTQGRHKEDTRMTQGRHKEDTRKTEGRHKEEIIKKT